MHYAGRITKCFIHFYYSRLKKPYNREEVLSPEEMWVRWVHRNISISTDIYFYKYVYC